VFAVNPCLISCTVKQQAKTQYTPRANYHETALSSIIKPSPDGYVPRNEKVALYEGPDAHNSCFDVPDESIDVFNVVTSRRLVEDDDVDEEWTYHHSPPKMTKNYINYVQDRRQLDSIVPGNGWEIWGEPQGKCDGTYNTTCNRWTGNECVLSGHHDGRGAIIGNEYSGWLVMTLKELKEGIIILKLHTWHTEDESTRTKGWKTVDNKRWLRSPVEQAEVKVNSNVSAEKEERQLFRSTDTPELPGEFEFQYSIDGKVTTLKRDEFLAKKQRLQRVVEVLTILDDPNFTKEPKDVEIAVRLIGSGSAIVFGLSHVYWA
jgi:hypothetical protein